jgi:FkbM family methyltransferase
MIILAPRHCGARSNPLHTIRLMSCGDCFTKLRKARSDELGDNWHTASIIAVKIVQLSLYVLMLRKLLKHIASLSPFPLTKNEYYDRLTEQVIKKVCNKDSVCVDAGANKGRILSMFIKHCPQNLHYAFEPIPNLYFALVRKYGSASKVFKVALSDKRGSSTFSYVVDDPAYSSLKQRNFHEHKTIQHFEVDTDCLDNLIPEIVSVDLIKLDIEGGEYEALLGSLKTIERCKPVVLFEFGKGGADAFGVTPKMMYDLFISRGYQINLLNGFLKSQFTLSLSSFEDEYSKGEEYFFVAHS